ncbi:hypothetical protein IKF43_01025 [Candidatus Saccharibacteria bacterium]|nr:hypothetical protein [Candidatus Saccharibacteria bacterium]
MPIDKLKKILADFDSSDATEFEYEDADFRVSIKKNGPKTDQEKTDYSDKHILSPLVGTYYDVSPTIQINERVKEGQSLCIIESMKIMNKICAPADLIIRKTYFENGESVEFGSKLFEVDYI